MTNPSESFAAQPLAARYLKACDDYLTACRSFLNRLADPSAGAADLPLPMAFLAPWKEFAQSLGMRWGDAPGAAFDVQSLFGTSFPALGLGREHQEIVQRMLNLAGQFQARYSELLKHGSSVAEHALQTMQRRGAGDAPNPDSQRAAYDAWIDSAEEAYATLAHSEPFARLLAELCNSLSAFKAERGKLIEYFARQLDLPSRAEVDSLHRQVRSLRNDMHNDMRNGTHGAHGAPAPKARSLRRRDGR